MKHNRSYYVLCLAVVLLTALAPISLFAQGSFLDKLKNNASVSDIQTLKSQGFSEKYVMFVTHPLDYNHPEKGSFRQRVIVGHVGFDRPTVIVTEGYGAEYALNPKYREELSKLLNANMIFVEHRYFLKSTPEPLDWQYLTAENSAKDLHSVKSLFGSLYPGKWISTGISKGGQTALLYRAFYPEDVDVTVPYVAPLCYGLEDGRHEPFINSVSTKEARQKVQNFQLEALKRKAILMPSFENHCAKNNLTFRIPLNEVYDYCVLEYSFSIWQWGTPMNNIPNTNVTDEAIFNHLMAICDPSYFAIGGSNTSFFVQAARELGYYGYDIKPFKKYLSIQTSKDYLRRLMLPDELRNVSFDKTLSRKIVTFLKKNDPRMIFIYGQNDPWTAAGVTWLKGKKNVHVYIQPNGSHLARISTLPDKEKEEVLSLIKKWLE